MSDFIQLHLLTSYPPSNLNRDDLGRPKTAVMGGSQRLRISSQSLKRAWRTSDVFANKLVGHLGKRTKMVGEFVREQLLNQGVAPNRAETLAARVVPAFRKAKEKKSEESDEAKEPAKKRGKKGAEPVPASLKTEQLMHLSAAEFAALERICAHAAKGEDITEEQVRALLKRGEGSSDIALFGRMLADLPGNSVEAAAQVAHAITVHKVTVEDDYFTAVDDLNRGEDSVGAGHIGNTEFAAGVFYQYVCIDRGLLVRNLGGDEALAKRTLQALLEACATVGPSGKQASFGSRAYASYALVERGTRQPRSLSVAFLKDVQGHDVLAQAIHALEDTRERMDKVYGPCATSTARFNVLTGEGTLQGLVDFVGA